MHKIINHQSSPSFAIIVVPSIAVAAAPDCCCRCRRRRRRHRLSSLLSLMEKKIQNNDVIHATYDYCFIKQIGRLLWPPRDKQHVKMIKQTN